MRINSFKSPVNILCLIIVGCGKITWGNTARLAASLIEHKLSKSAEFLGTNISAKASANELLLQLEGLNLDDFIKLLDEFYALDANCPNWLKEQLKGELLSEESDYDLQAARGFNEALLGIKNDLEIKDNLDEFFKALKQSHTQIVLNLASSNLELNHLQSGLISLDYHSKNLNNDDLLNKLKSYEKGAFSYAKLNLAKKPFDLTKSAACSQSFMYFGCILGEFNLHQRACAAIASMAFGSGFSSRLTEVIRVQNGLAYSAYARVAYCANTAYWLGLMQTKSSNETKAKELINKLFNELKDGINEDEFIEAKNYLLSSEVLQQKDYISSFKMLCSCAVAGLRDDFNAKLMQEVSKLNLEQVNSFLSEFAKPISFYVVHNA